MKYRPHPAPAPLLFGYDPVRDLPERHLARLVEWVVEDTVQPDRGPVRRGQPAYDPRLCVKVLVYGYATGVRSSRQLERLCGESLPYLFLTRGETPSYHTLCTARRERSAELEAVWVGLLSVAETVGLTRVGRLVVDSTKLRANASSESVVRTGEYDAVLAELHRVLAEAERVDAREAQEGGPGETELKALPKPDQMRDVLRRVRKRLAQAKRADEPAASTSGVAEPPPRLTDRMRARVQEAIGVLESVQDERRKHVSLTDPDAQMMPEGREKRLREGHCFEVATDQGLLVAGGSCQDAQDNGRLLGLVAQAQEHEPQGVVAVDGDSGYYSGDGVAELIQHTIDTCIPDSHTASDLHRGLPVGTTRARGRGSVPLHHDSAADCYRCPQGNELRRVQERQHCGQRVRVYRAVTPCRECPLAAQCLTQRRAKHKVLKVGEHHELLEAARQRFADPEHRARYRQRGRFVEGVFGFLRSVLGFTRWLLRGKDAVRCEASLFQAAYQLRKVHRLWAAA
ncbi:MAG: hypothetical protein QG597_2059 [Actinomycetota bacterium]|nr:hypothetical protein [Actinomycetota bacterium]